MILFKFIRWHKYAVILLIFCSFLTFWTYIQVPGFPDSPFKKDASSSFPDVMIVSPFFDNSSILNDNLTYFSLESGDPLTEPRPDDFKSIIPPLIGGIVLIYLLSELLSLRPRKIAKTQVHTKIKSSKKINKSPQCLPSQTNFKLPELEKLYPVSTTSTSSSFQIMGAKTSGQSHVKQGKPCQDAFAYHIQDSYAIIAVADGLGSAALSEIGSDWAVNCAVNYIQTRISSCSPDENLDLPSLVHDSFIAARKKLIEIAREGSYPLQDLATTLIIAVSNGSVITTGQIGDGAVVAEINGTITLISSPGEQEYCNETTPLTSDSALGETRIKTFHGHISNIAAFTDGCQRAALHRDGGTYVPFTPFFTPLFNYLAIHPESNDETIVELLKSEKMALTSEDDKTLVITLLVKDGEACS